MRECITVGGSVPGGELGDEERTLVSRGALPGFGAIEVSGRRARTMSYVDDTVEFEPLVGDLARLLDAEALVAALRSAEWASALDDAGARVDISTDENLANVDELALGDGEPHAGARLVLRRLEVEDAVIFMMGLQQLYMGVKKITAANRIMITAEARMAPSN